MPKLGRLTVMRTKVTPEGVAKLKQTNPKLLKVDFAAAKPR
jgi:hypothetical protein